MARIARIVIPGVPHHLVQRGNRRMRTFFADLDYKKYLGLMRQWCDQEGVKVWAYCLMPNHIHLIAVPENEQSLRRGIGEAHRRYSKYINELKGWRGHLWQERFYSCPLDDHHLFEAARYIELNPTKAQLVKCPDDYRWSSARAHLKGGGDPLLSMDSLSKWIPDWDAYLAEGLEKESAKRIEQHLKTGRPLGDQSFVSDLERRTGRVLLLKKRGRRVNF